MSQTNDSGRIDWTTLGLVVFDVDGTLYDQRRLRFVMLLALLRHVIRTRQTRFLRVIRAYRRIREELSDDEVAGFEPVLLARTAAASGCSVEFVSATVSDWIDRRPLVHLQQCIYPGVAELFAALRRRGVSIGVLSDYPATAKLAALGLRADHVVSAVDIDIERLKPHPLGLQTLLHRAGIAPEAALMVGDRVDRDGEVARRAHVQALIRTSRPVAGWRCFRRYDDPVFQDVLNG